jgi:type II secretory pathway component PulF
VALYAYQALSKDGKKLKGQVDAPSKQAVNDQLVRQNLYPVHIELAKEESVGFDWRRIFERPVSAKEKILFTKQLAVLLSSGVPLLQAMELLSEQFDARMKRIMVSLKDMIKEGNSLAQGLAMYPSVFENIFVQLVRAGEASGKLEFILVRLTEYLERRLEQRKRIVAALRQPLIQLGLIVLIAIFLVTYVVPRIAATFAKAGGELPLPTRILMGISAFMQHYFVLVAILFVAIVLLFSYWRKTVGGRMTLDALKLRIPLVGYFSRMNAIVQFSSTLGMLLEGGVRLSESLDIVCAVVDNQVLAHTLIEAKEKIVKEGKIAQYLKQTKIFPTIAIYLIKTGEETGQLDTMLITVAKNYEADLQELTDTLSAQIDPLILLFMASVVGFIVISIALPLANMTNLAMKGL